MRRAVVKAPGREALSGALWTLVAQVGAVAGARLTVDVDPIDL